MPSPTYHEGTQITPWRIARQRSESSARFRTDLLTEPEHFRIVGSGPSASESAVQPPLLGARPVPLPTQIAYRRILSVTMLGLLGIGCATEGGNLPAGTSELRVSTIRSYPAWSRAVHFHGGGPLRDTTPIPVSAIRSVGADSLGRVYVLDAAARRVLVFDSLGSPLGVVGEGYGSGPKELRQPGDMQVGAAGELLVTDIGDRRVLYFDSAGMIASSFSFTKGIPATAIKVDSAILLLRSASLSTDTLVMKLNLDGEIVGAIRVGDKHQRAMVEAGPLGTLTTTGDGIPIYVTPYPAKWQDLASVQRAWLGSDLLPALKTEHIATPGTDVPLSYITAAVLGASCPNLQQCLLTLVRLQDPSDPAKSPYDTWVYLIGAEGEVIASTKLPDVRRVFRAPGRQRLYLVKSEPEPHVELASYTLSPAVATAQ